MARVHVHRKTSRFGFVHTKSVAGLAFLLVGFYSASNSEKGLAAYVLSRPDFGPTTSSDSATTTTSAVLVAGYSYSEILSEVYRPAGNSLCRQSYSPHWLCLCEPIDCQKAFSRLFEDKQEVAWPPPETVPTELLESYTLGNRIPVLSYYFSAPTIAQQYNGASRAYQWDAAAVQAFVDKATRREVTMGYGAEINALYLAVENNAIRGEAGLVVGSRTPWVESILLAQGARHVTTAEYHPINATHPQVDAIHPLELAKQFLAKQAKLYDFAASFSSLEHSGLGRYGDPLNPNGDIEELQRIGCLVKPDGLLFLGLPMGLDRLAWNAHRIYGRLRIPLIVSNWQVVNVYLPSGEVKGEDLATAIWSHGSVDEKMHQLQPVIVLRNKISQPCYRH